MLSGVSRSLSVLSTSNDLISRIRFISNPLLGSLTTTKRSHSRDAENGLHHGCPSQTSSVTEPSTDDKYMKYYRLTGAGQNNFISVRTNTGYSISTDTPIQVGGTDLAPQPVELLIASWMGCTQATATFVGRNMRSNRLMIEKLEFDNVEARRDERGALSNLPIKAGTLLPDIPPRLQEIKGTIRVFLQNNEKISKMDLELLANHTESRCPVASMILASGCQINVSWKSGTLSSS